MPSIRAVTNMTLKPPLAPRSFLRGVIIMVLFLAAAGPAHCLWMPWATEADKIKKTIDDVWRALLAGNRIALEENLVSGPSSKVFIEQELDFIRKMRVRSFYFRFRQIKIDNVKNQWAWVALDKIAALANGSRMSASTVMVFKKEDGFWKLYTNPKTMRARKKEDDERKAEHSGDSDLRAPKKPKTTPASGFQWSKGPAPNPIQEKAGGEESEDSGAMTASNITVESQGKSIDNQKLPSRKGAVEPANTKAFFKWEKEPMNTAASSNRPKKHAQRERASVQSSGGWTVEKGPAPKKAPRQ